MGASLFRALNVAIIYDNHSKECLTLAEPIYLYPSKP